MEGIAPLARSDPYRPFFYAAVFPFSHVVPRLNIRYDVGADAFSQLQGDCFMQNGTRRTGGSCAPESLAGRSRW